MLNWIIENKKMVIMISIAVVLFVSWKFGYIDKTDIKQLVELLKQVLTLIKDILSDFKDFIIDIWGSK